MRSASPRHVGAAADLAFMGLDHEATPRGVDPGVGWYERPSYAQAMQPNNSLIPWWPGPDISEWKGITGWWIAYAASTGHTATNAAVEVAGQRLAILRKSGQWEVLSERTVPNWFGSYGEDAVTPGDPAPWSATGLAGGLEFQPGNTYGGGGQSIHGGTALVRLWDEDFDVDCIHMMVRHRLTLRNRGGIDDRGSARIVIQAGADYWPDENSTVADVTPPGYLPGVGTGRFLLVRPEWRISTFICRNFPVDVTGNPPPVLL